jgi:tRNA(fMet)-specific endonuclease VapC
MSMNGSVIDTNVIIKMMHEDSTAISLLEKIDRKYIPIIVAGELFFGAYKSTKRDANMELFQDILSNFEILYVDDAVALSYALIKSDLAKKGTPIPENDIWIAATAHANNLSVATFDDHFACVLQIKLVPIGE